MRDHTGILMRERRVIVGMIFGFLFGAMVMVAGTAWAQHGGANAVGQPTAASAPSAANQTDAAYALLTGFKNEGGQMGGQRGAAGPNDAEHSALVKLVGEYDRVIKFLGQTGATAQPSSGTCTFSVELGGRFIVEKSHDVVFGRPVDGLRIYGYNDTTKQYEMARMYTMSNGITLMKGTSSDGGKTIEFSAEASKMPLRAHFRQIDEDHFSVTMATTDANGKDMPFQETDYTRKK
ncbi:MAG: DUF1579 family protein [Candidatus Acidiferrales bacterium]